MENASIENASTEMHGWNTQVQKTQVKICRGGKRKYGNGKSDLDADTTEKYHCQSTTLNKMASVFNNNEDNIMSIYHNMNATLKTIQFCNIVNIFRKSH